jgi:hypothetical protein
MASDQRPEASSKAEATNWSAAWLSARASATFRPVAASLQRRATTVAAQVREGSGISFKSLISSPRFTAV